jgi:DUF2075 family protein
VRIYGPGFEFDYVGVIFGRDLVYEDGWKGNRKISLNGHQLRDEGTA